MSSYTKIQMSEWCHQAPRDHTHMMLCFALDESVDDAEEIVTHNLEDSLNRLAIHRPDFTDIFTTVFDPDTCHKQTHRLRADNEHIPFESHSIKETYPYSFEELRKSRFPASAFLDKRFTVSLSPDGTDPAIVVKAFFIQGGLLLGVYVSHQILDGEGCHKFLECLAAETRGDPIPQYPTSTTLNIPDEFLFPDASPGELIARCPELGRLDSDSPSSSSSKKSQQSKEEQQKPTYTGKIFRFPLSNIHQLQHLLRPSDSTTTTPPPSTFFTLIAFLWSHITKARMHVLPSAFSPPTLQILTSFANRTLVPYTTAHMGNTVICTHASLHDEAPLLSGCVDPWVLGDQVVPAMEAAVKEVGEKGYVAARMEMARRGVLDSVRDDDGAMMKGQKMGLVFRKEGEGNEGNLTVNSWRWFGGKTVWGLFGGGEDGQRQKPEAIRRPAEEWWGPYGINILPAVEVKEGEDEELEVIVQLEEGEMKRLMKDGGFMKWVGGVIG